MTETSNFKLRHRSPSRKLHFTPIAVPTALSDSRTPAIIKILNLKSLQHEGARFFANYETRFNHTTPL